jgi:hypothetical protein
MPAMIRPELIPQEFAPLEEEVQATLQDPRNEIVKIATSIGIPEAQAKAMANYLAQSFDLYKGEEVWGALLEVPEIFLSLRKKFFRTWMSYIGEVVPPRLDQTVKASGGRDQSQTTDGLHPRKPHLRYIAVQGEVQLMPEDDESDMGVPFAVALQMAEQQVSKRAALRPVQPEAAAPPAQDSSVMVAMVNAQSKLTETVMTMIGGSGGEDPEKKQLAADLQSQKTENLRIELNSKMDLQSAELRNAIKDSNQQLTTALTSLADAVKGIAQTTNTPAPSLLEGINQVVALKDALSALMPQPATAAPAPLYAFKGPDGTTLPLLP